MRRTLCAAAAATTKRRKHLHMIVGAAMMVFILAGCSSPPAWALGWTQHQSGREWEDDTWIWYLPPTMEGSAYGTSWRTPDDDVIVVLGMSEIPDMLDDNDRLRHDVILAYNPPGTEVTAPGVEIPVKMSNSFPKETDMFAVCYNGCEPTQVDEVNATARVFFLTFSYDGTPGVVGFAVSTASHYYPKSKADVAIWIQAFNLTVRPAPRTPTPRMPPSPTAPTPSPSHTPTPTPSATTLPTATSSCTKQAGSADSYSRYTNDQFGFSLDVPDPLAELGPEHRESKEWGCLEGPGRLSVSGENNTSGKTIRSAMDEQKTIIEAEFWRITYSQETAQGFVLSGYTDDGFIFYNATWVGPGSLNHMIWIYPQNQKAQVDIWVSRTYDSFSPGDLNKRH